MAVFHDAGAEEHVDSADFGDEMEFSDSELDEQPAATGGGAAMGGPAPTAAGSTTTAPAAGGAVVARNNATFKADARAAFVQMALHADSNIPHAQVLARPPDAASAGRERCPPPLWALIQTHGGYTEQGRNGVSRSRIINQFRLWRKDTFGGGEGARRVAATAVTQTSLATILQQLVPHVGVLMASTAGMRDEQSTVLRNRPTTQSVQLWTGTDCEGFWTAQRNSIITVIATAAHDHAKDKRYIEKMTHTRASYVGLNTILVERDCPPFQRDASCDFCEGRGTARCDCLWMVAYEAVDMFVRIVLDHVNEDPDTRRLVSPPGNASVPVESADAVYNIAGALLFKIKQHASGGTLGVTEYNRCSCTAFVAAHSLDEAHARRAALPVEKVVCTQHSRDSLTYVSAPLYHFFCKLELMYWFNLNLRCVGGLSAETMQNIDAFARTDRFVLSAWRRCVERVAEKTATDVREVERRSVYIFEMLAKTYRNVRGKEYTKVYAEQHRRDGAVRTSTIRDQLAAGIAVTASKK